MDTFRWFMIALGSSPRPLSLCFEHSWPIGGAAECAELVDSVVGDAGLLPALRSLALHGSILTALQAVRAPDPPRPRARARPTARAGALPWGVAGPTRPRGGRAGGRRRALRAAAVGVAGGDPRRRRRADRGRRARRDGAADRPAGGRAPAARLRRGAPRPGDRASPAQRGGRGEHPETPVAPKPADAGARARDRRRRGASNPPPTARAQRSITSWSARWSVSPSCGTSPSSR